MRTYRFECYDDEDKTQVTIEFSTESDSWSGYDGPMWKFFDFLKGCGYVFDKHAEIGVMDPSFARFGDEFRSASEDDIGV